ncbi:MAG: ribosome silencing factor [Candidatus Omnitrophota bacterium]
MSRNFANKKVFVAIRKKNTSSRTIAKLIAEFATNKKADNIVILDMRKVVNFCDYFVICSATSERRLKAIADEIDQELGKRGVRARFARGKEESQWMLLDVGGVVVHIFTEDTRQFYGLEHLWQDAPHVNWKSKTSS